MPHVAARLARENFLLPRAKRTPTQRFAGFLCLAASSCSVKQLAVVLRTAVQGIECVGRQQEFVLPGFFFLGGSVVSQGAQLGLEFSVTFDDVLSAPCASPILALDVGVDVVVQLVVNIQKILQTIVGGLDRGR